jgi:inosine/xanthosine triphosphatase
MKKRILVQKNRIKNLKGLTTADYYVSMEGGVEFKEQDLECFAWMIIESHELQGKARTGTFFLPHKVGELIQQGMELGDADDVVFGGTNSKQKNGSIGILTKDVLTRTSFYTEALIMALIPFHNESLYEQHSHTLQTIGQNNRANLCLHS